MNNRELEGKIKSAVEKAAPDMWERLERDIGYGKGDTITLSDSKRKSKWLGVISGLAAALVLIAAGVFGIVNYNRADEKIVSTVAIEVNPEIILSLNTYNVVLKAEADNEDGKKIIEKTNLEGLQLDLALDSVVASMVKEGYLSDKSNTMLLSVKNDDSVKEKALYYEVMDNATRAMDSENFNGCAVVQRLSLSNEKEVQALAERHNISRGKADFIYLFYKSVKATEDELAKLSVNDLNLIFESDYNHEKYKDSGDITYSGKSSDKKYIGLDKLKEIVFKNADAEEKYVRRFDADFDVEDGIMVYEVDFVFGSTKYEYEVNAISGEILKKETKEYKESEYGAESSKPQLNFITGEDALKIALEDAGIKRSDATDIDAEIDSDDPIKHIDTEFTAGGYDYEYEIASDGRILNRKKELSD